MANKKKAKLGLLGCGIPNTGVSCDLPLGESAEEFASQPGRKENACVVFRKEVQESVVKGL